MGKKKTVRCVGGRKGKSGEGTRFNARKQKSRHLQAGPRNAEKPQSRQKGKKTKKKKKRVNTGGGRDQNSETKKWKKPIFYNQWAEVECHIGGEGVLSPQGGFRVDHSKIWVQVTNPKNMPPKLGAEKPLHKERREKVKRVRTHRKKLPKTMLTH